MRSRILLVGLLLTFASCVPVLAWQEGDRQAYNNKMALLKVMLDGAKDRVTQTGDLETLCLLMSIGNDVTMRYMQMNPEDRLIEQRLTAMRDDLTVCLAVLYNPQAQR